MVTADEYLPKCNLPRCIGFANIAMRQIDKNNIIVYGESIGAPIDAHITRKYQFKTLFFDYGLPIIKKVSNVKCLL